jgi:hypothetical protein
MKENGKPFLKNVEKRNRAQPITGVPCITPKNQMKTSYKKTLAGRLCNADLEKIDKIKCCNH